jgi:hypothetical protein
MPWYDGCRIAGVRRAIRAVRISVLAAVLLAELALFLAPDSIVAAFQPERPVAAPRIERADPFRQSLPRPCGRCGRHA